MKPSSILFIVLILAVFYALFILPNRRQQKNRQNMMRQLGPGARILTSGGIYGEVVAVEGDVYIIEIADDVEIEVDQRAIIRVVEGAPTQLHDGGSGVEEPSEPSGPAGDAPAERFDESETDKFESHFDDEQAQGPGSEQEHKG